LFPLHRVPIAVWRNEGKRGREQGGAPVVAVREHTQEVVAVPFCRQMFKGSPNTVTRSIKRSS
jgi:hypothetical protein